MPASFTPQGHTSLAIDADRQEREIGAFNRVTGWRVQRRDQREGERSREQRFPAGDLDFVKPPGLARLGYASLDAVEIRGNVVIDGCYACLTSSSQTHTQESHN